MGQSVLTILPCRTNWDNRRPYAYCFSIEAVAPRPDKPAAGRLPFVHRHDGSPDFFSPDLVISQVSFLEESVVQRKIGYELSDEIDFSRSRKK